MQRSGWGASGSVISLLPRAIRSLFEGAGGAAQWVDFVTIALLAVLLLEYDLLRACFGRNTGKRLRPFGIAIAPLLIAFVVVIAHRWRQLSR